MINKKELLNTTEYWVEELQNQIYREVSAYMELHKLNRTDLAKEWGVSKGYITQVLGGECNFSLKKWVELTLKMQKAPVVEYVYTNDIYEMDKISRMVNQQMNKPLQVNYTRNKLIGITQSSTQTLSFAISSIQTTQVKNTESAEAA
jgi:hypothetical protein